jgi:hypothetical protein
VKTRRGGWLSVACWAVVIGLGYSASTGWAGRVADIRNTKHNLSSNSTNQTRASGAAATLPDGTATAVNTTEVCVYCHTPHNASAKDGQGGVLAPLWNRRVGKTEAGADVSYTRYSSSTLDAGTLSNPEGSSKLCLSCHDGMIALGNVGVIGGQGRSLSDSSGPNVGVSIPFQTVDAAGNTVATSTMPDGVVANTGFTRRLGTDLSNDHPISVAYTQALANNDGELRVGAADPNGSGTVVVAGNNLAAGANGWSRQTFAAAVARRGSGVKALLPLETASAANLSNPTAAGTVQCATCHDPHIRDDAGTENIKFLRGSRMQRRSQPSDSTYDAGSDILCLACHDKAGNIWFNSAHANSVDADEVYKRDTSGTAGTYNAAGQRDLPTNADTQVWQFACLNCHDPHTVPGARRLLREGIGGASAVTTVSGKGIFRTKVGPGTPALEETCFQCHRSRTDVDNPLNMPAASGQTVPDIKTDFDAAGTTNRGTYPLASAMPIRASEQCGGGEKHSIGDAVAPGTAAARAGKDFVEAPATLGYSIGGQSCDTTSSRHVECTDCHNPHRVQKGNHFGTNGGTDIRGTAGGNLVSNVLKGTVGVEPVYPSDTRFGVIPTSFDLLCGSGVGIAYTGCNAAVTKEYQVCLKCHSNYAYSDINDPVGDGANGGMYNYTGRPLMGYGPTTPTGRTEFQGANGVNLFPGPAGTTRYTNQAMEFRGPDEHKYECNNDTCANDTGNKPTHALTGVYATPNHRSWHPVMQPTGRTKTERGSTLVDNFTNAWTNNVGAQTMYCTDCHGRDTTTGTSNCNNTTTRTASTNTMPYISSSDCATGSGPRYPAGPHGSNNAFILKGKYNSGNFDLCLKCHQGLYGSRSGFCCDKDNNLHAYHRSKMGSIACYNCHIAVPHGWKHKALLADTRTVGNEVGNAADTNVTYTNAQGYTKGPYYLNAMLKVTTWKRSGQWTSSDCNGGVNGMKSACMNN